MERLGPFRLRRRLAVGGMGEVYLGEKIGPEGFVKPVVIKCVLPQLAKDRAFVQLFLDEARLAALLNHPNIAQIYDFGLIDDIYFIAMEYVPGYTVDDVRRKLKSIGHFMPIEHVAQIASQACQGLNYAHSLTDSSGVSLGLVHRDVSPHNLIISVDGSVKIVDFGIAKARAGLTRVQARGAVGKFGYMSPEQSRGEVVDGRSDVFSLGICLWELATSERLHDPSLERAPDYVPSEPIRSPDTLRHDLPKQFVQILQHALEIDPKERFASCREMHLDLERFLAAMTHFAGQTALAQYISDLAEGRVEHPSEKSTGVVVEPATKPGTVRAVMRTNSPSAAESMEAAQKYEEVFGVSMEGPRSRPRAGPVPKSWETKNKTPTGDPQQLLGTRTPPALLEEEPALEMASREPREARDVPRVPPEARPAPIQRRSRPRTRNKPLLLASLGFIGLLIVGYAQRTSLLSFLKPKAEAPVKLTSVYRIESEPADADVLIDGSLARSTTPIDIELIPQVEYVITVKKKGFGTSESVVRASVGTEIRLLRFTLPEAATLHVVSRPPGARISINGRVIEGRVTPLTVDDVPAKKPLRIVASLRGLPDAIDTVEIPPGKKKTVRLLLSDHEP